MHPAADRPPTDIAAIRESLAKLRHDPTHKVTCPEDGGRIRPDPSDPIGTYVFCEGRCGRTDFIPSR